MNFEEYVEYRLQEWADWFRGGKLGKGYPAESAFNLFQKEMTINKTKYQQHNFMPVNEGAEEIEKMVIDLDKYNKKFAEALKKSYLGTELTTALKAKSLNLTASTFKKYVEMGRLWVVAKMNIKYN